MLVVVMLTCFHQRWQQMERRGICVLNLQARFDLTGKRDINLFA
jgi:hypothetical protein